MAVRIRLTRVGATKRPAYRVIAIDKRRSRDGRALEILGFYDPLTEPATVQLDTARIQAWIGKGAQPSDTVAKLMRQSEREAAAGAEADKPKRPTRATTPKKPSKKSQTKQAAAATETEATPAESAPAESAPAESAPAESAPADVTADASDAGTPDASGSAEGASDAGSPDAEAKAEA